MFKVLLLCLIYQQPRWKHDNVVKWIYFKDLFYYIVLRFSLSCCRLFCFIFLKKKYLSANLKLTLRLLIVRVNRCTTILLLRANTTNNTLLSRGMLLLIWWRHFRSNKIAWTRALKSGQSTREARHFRRICAG